MTWWGRPRKQARGDEGVDRRIVVISADIGAGHDAAARELSERLASEGFEVDRLNLLSMLPRPFNTAVRETYRGMLSWLPSSYHALFTVTSRFPFSIELIRALLRPAFRGMLRQLPPDTRAIVTTFPFANQLLGPMRRDRLITAPLITYVTDFSVHPAWVAPGVDLYCVVHDASRQQALATGAREVRVVRPLVSPRFAALPHLGTRQARRRFGLPEQARLALILAGSWGVGDVGRTAAEVLATGCAVPVVVCGRNKRLYRRLRRFPGYVLGWVDDMPTLMRAADVIVENAGGLTCQEALAAGLPTITYRPIPGHGKANTALLTRCALTNYVASPQQLQPTLTRLMSQAGASPAIVDSGLDMASVIAEFLPQVQVARPWFGPRRP